jgi:hypothetical protein
MLGVAAMQGRHAEDAQGMNSGQKRDISVQL